MSARDIESPRPLAFTKSGQATAALADAARELIGEDVGDLSLVRKGTNVVAASNRHGAIFRVSSADSSTALTENLAHAHALADGGVPLVGPLTRRVAGSRGLWVTAWPKADLPQDNLDEYLGTALRGFHEARVSRKLPTTDVIEKIEKRLSRVSKILPKDLFFYLKDRSSLVIDEIASGLLEGNSLIHGDAHSGNLVLYQGTPAMVDLDGISQGPTELDIAPVVNEYQRFHRNERKYAAFIDAYGLTFDRDTLDRLILLRETTMNTWLATLWNESPAARKELCHRISTWDSDWRIHRPWSAL